MVKVALKQKEKEFFQNGDRTHLKTIKSKFVLYVYRNEKSEFGQTPHLSLSLVAATVTAVSVVSAKLLHFAQC